MTEARIGWGGKLYLGTDNTEATLVQLAEVRERRLPAGRDRRARGHAPSVAGPAQGVHPRADRRRRVHGDAQLCAGLATDLALTEREGSRHDPQGPHRHSRRIRHRRGGLEHHHSAFVKKYAPDNMEPNEVDHGDGDVPRDRRGRAGRWAACRFVGRGEVGRRPQCPLRPRLPRADGG
jgi:hypothetical protein